MRRFARTLLLLAAALLAQAQDAVGVEERLGAQVPLDLVLKAEDGSPVRLGQLLGKPTILTLNYFRCAGICTPLLNGVVEVVDRTQAVPGTEFQVLTVSFDGRDTPEIAAQKRANYLAEIKRPMPAGAWRFLTGPDADTRALADAVGFKFKREGEDFIHAGVIVFLSPNGRVTRYMYGTTFLPADLQMAVGEAARGEASPTITKLLKICFNQDPAGRGYVFSATKAGAIVVVLLALGYVVYLVRPRRRTQPQSGESP
ncbi:MAG: SCO family protein [Acidobacteria bacterium]|nr:SCO family protein [Acidobacteriota bacterium]